MPAFGALDKVSEGWSFLNSSYVTESINNITATFWKPAPLLHEFWDMAIQQEKNLLDHVPRLLADAAAFFESASFTNITSAMHHMVNTTAAFRANISDALAAHPITFDTFTKELENAFMTVVSDLQTVPAPDKALGHLERAEVINKVLGDATLALMNLTTQYGIKEDVVASYLFVMKPHLQTVIVTVGDISEQYPQLFSILAFSIAVLLIPESWILRPFLSMFGFGPTGPVRGSAAAWLQRYFWGATVEAGSWFAGLQAAGMGVYPKWAGFVAKAPLLGGLLAGLASMFGASKRE